MDFSALFGPSLVPEDLKLQKLMLLGAMYVEENGILEAIHDNVDEDSDEEEIQEVLIDGFCSLDMNGEGMGFTEETRKTSPRKIF